MIAIDDLELGVVKQVPEEYRSYLTLWWYVLDLTLRDAAKHMEHRGKPDYRNRDTTGAYNWLFSNSEAAPGFLWLCDILDLNPESVRLKFNANWRNLINN